MENIINHVHVNVPFTMLLESYLDIFLDYKLNPEIGLDYPALTGFSIDDFKRVAQKFQERNLKITFHGPFMDISPGSRDKDIRAVAKKRFEQMLELVPVFNPVTVVCHAGYDRRHFSWYREDWLANSIDMWTWLSGRLSDEGSRLMLENVYEDGPEDIQVVFESLAAHDVGFCFDIGHQAAFGKASVSSWLNTLGQYLGQLHLHDNCGDWDDHVAIGQGTINYQPLWDHLLTMKDRLPVITLEPHEEKDLWPSIVELEKLKLF
ncbi:MAG: sugar phosphate isomerase/epimerase [Proteobacteria bacterium]|nr:sugar phosphate isomerase/epimerase [Pseudomonadota bacterium]